MAKVLEYQRCKIEHGTERNISIKKLDMQEGMSGISDLTPPNNGYSISCTAELVNSLYKDGLLTSDLEFGQE